MDKNRVRPLELNKLKLSDKAYDYYDRHYKFITVSGYGYDKTPILESASNFISHEHLQLTDGIKLKYPFKSYIEGFIDEYNYPISGDLNTDEGREFVLVDVQPNPELPAINYRYPNGIQEPYFSEEEAYKYGSYNAKAFKVWEFIIKHLPYYEKIFCATENQKTGLAPKEGLTPEHFEQLYKYLIDDKRKWIEVRENTKRDFLAIFSTNTLPQGWKPIKWLHLTKFKEPHGEILFNIMYLSCENAKQSYLFYNNAISYFETNSGKFGKSKHKKFTDNPRFLKNILPQQIQHPTNP